MKISQVLNKIDDNQLFVPAFQREYVWKRDHAKELMSSLIKDYPTGTMLTWETTNPPELKGKWKYNKNQGAVKLILDGQQRITTLYLLIRGVIPPYYSESEIINDTRGLYVNVETLELQYYKKTLMEGNPIWQDLTDIFQKNVRYKDVVRLLREREVVSTERDDRIDDNFRTIEIIPDREFIEQSIPIKASLKEAIDIFYVVNASGVNLTDAELALAQVSGYWPEARGQFKAKLRKLEEGGFVFKLDFLVYVLLGVLHRGGSEMKKLHTPDNLPRIKEAWNLLETQVLDFVMNILKTHAYVDHTDEINSVYALVPIIVFCFNKGKSSLSQDEIRKMVKWFYYSQIRQRYVSQTAQRLDKDVSIVFSSAAPFDELLGIIQAERPLEITKDEFVGVDIRHPLYGLMRWYFKSQNAVCLTTGVGLRKNMGKKYDLESDHIFPYSILKEAGYNKNNRLKYSFAHEITNRAILTKVANRGKLDKPADAYLAIVEKQFPDALALQCIPTNHALWRLDKFESFLEERRKILAGKLNDFLQGITESTEVVVETPIEELVADGEGEDLEFKASLLWSYELSNVDKKLEQVVVKSVSAFANADGGTLLIGIANSGQILGLEHDFVSLKGNRDEFELHLRNLFNYAFGETFTATNVTITFPMVEEMEICRIDVQASDEPLYLTVSDKNGVKLQKFYVRSGNSSPDLPMNEAAKYVKQRFK